MNLYRIDMIGEGGSRHPVCDLLGPRLLRRRAAADAAARMAVAATQQPAELTRISGAGRCTVMGTFEVSGKWSAVRVPR